MDRNTSRTLRTFAFVLAVAVGLAVLPAAPVSGQAPDTSPGQRVTIDPDGLTSSGNHRMSVDPDGLTSSGNQRVTIDPDGLTSSGNQRVTIDPDGRV